MGALFPNQVTIKIGAASVAGSGSLTDFTTKLKNIEQSGGEKKIESQPLFGGAFIDLEKPREQYEVTMDGVVFFGTQSLLFDQLVMGSVLDGSTAVDSNDSQNKKVIYVQWYDGTNYYTRAYNNCSGVSFEPKMEADGYLEGSIKFNLSATDESGNANIKVSRVALSTITWP